MDDATRCFLSMNSDSFHLFVFILVLFSSRESHPESYGEKKRVGLNKMVTNNMTFVNVSCSNRVLCPVIRFNAEYFPSLLIHLKYLTLLKKQLRDGLLLNRWDPGEAKLYSDAITMVLSQWPLGLLMLGGISLVVHDFIAST